MSATRWLPRTFVVRAARLTRPARLALAGVAVLASVAGAQAPATPATPPAGPAGPAGPAAGTLAPPARVQLGVTVSADTVRIGEPFTVVVRVRAPRGATVVFPVVPDSTAGIQALDPVTIVDAADAAAVERTATYRIAAWDLGLQPIVLPPVEVRTAESLRRVGVENVGVFVASVLPADSAQRVPKPPRPVFEFPWPWWLKWLLAALAAAVVGGLLWWWWRWWRRRRPARATDPFGEAQAAFARIESLQLLEAGERTRYVELVAEVLRDYLAARDAAALPSLTSSELVAALRGSAVVPVPRVDALLRDVDLVKFARRDLAPERARAIGGEAQALVRDVEAAHVAAVAEAAERAAREARDRREARARGADGLPPERRDREEAA